MQSSSPGVCFGLTYRIRLILSQASGMVCFSVLSFNFCTSFKPNSADDIALGNGKGSDQWRWQCARLLSLATSFLTTSELEPIKRPPFHKTRDLSKSCKLRKYDSYEFQVLILIDLLLQFIFFLLCIPADFGQCTNMMERRRAGIILIKDSI